MFNLIANINGYVEIIPYKIDDKTYLRVKIKHDNLEIAKFIDYKVTWDEGFLRVCDHKMLLEILNREEKDGD